MIAGVIKTILVIPTFGSIDEAFAFHFKLVDNYPHLNERMNAQSEVRFYTYTYNTFVIHIYIPTYVHTYIDTYIHT